MVSLAHAKIVNFLQKRNHLKIFRVAHDDPADLPSPMRSQLKHPATVIRGEQLVG
jgi:hypothetical protein